MVPGLRLEMSASPLSAEEIEFMKDKPYLRAIGKLTWLANGTRPDIAYAVGVLAHLNKCAGKAQWTTVKLLLCYVKGTMDYKLQYGLLLPLTPSQLPTLLEMLTLPSRQPGLCF
jgi:hypothetical protein